MNVPKSEFQALNNDLSGSQSYFTGMKDDPVDI